MPALRHQIGTAQRRAAQRAQRIAGSVALTAMAQALNQIGAAVPFGVPRRIRGEGFSAEIKPTPGLDQAGQIPGEGKRSGLIGLRNLRQRTQPGKQGV